MEKQRISRVVEIAVSKFSKQLHKEIDGKIEEYLDEYDCSCAGQMQELKTRISSLIERDESNKTIIRDIRDKTQKYDKHDKKLKSIKKKFTQLSDDIEARLKSVDEHMQQQVRQAMEKIWGECSKLKQIPKPPQCGFMFQSAPSPPCSSASAKRLLQSTAPSYPQNPKLPRRDFQMMYPSPCWLTTRPPPHSLQYPNHGGVHPA